MKRNVYVQLEESPSSGYISIKGAVPEANIEESYRDLIKNGKLFGSRKKEEAFEGFKLRYIHIEVNHDGRKGIKNHDILQSLSSHNLAIKKGESMFGGFYLPTNKLKSMLEKQLSKRKELINNNVYEVIA